MLFKWKLVLMTVIYYQNKVVTIMAVLVENVQCT